MITPAKPPPTTADAAIVESRHVADELGRPVAERTEQRADQPADDHHGGETHGQRRQLPPADGPAVQRKEQQRQDRACARHAVRQTLRISACGFPRSSPRRILGAKARQTRPRSLARRRTAVLLLGREQKATTTTPSATSARPTIGSHTRPGPRAERSPKVGGERFFSSGNSWVITSKLRGIREGGDAPYFIGYRRRHGLDNAGVANVRPPHLNENPNGGVDESGLSERGFYPRRLLRTILKYQTRE